MIKYLIAGMRFDITALTILNLPIIVLFLFPKKIFSNAVFQKFLNSLFFVINIPAILLNLVDLAYFKFTNKRTTADLFDLFTLGSDMANTLPNYAISFWYVPFITIILGYFIYRFLKSEKRYKQLISKGKTPLIFVLTLVTIGLSIIGFRGGIQYRPIDMLSAANYAEPKHIPIVLNTPFTIMKTLNKTELKQRNYFDPSTANQHFNTIQKSNPLFRASPNIILIILESFSSEYIGILNNNKGYTPFLDSLSKHSMLFTNTYANGKKSIEGLPAIIAGIPALMNDPIITSVFNSNRVPSLPKHLEPLNYDCSFFHGGNNGTMGFDKFTTLSGFEKYYGRTEYPGDDYDGHWGIFDEPFYKFFSSTINQSTKPFFSVFFSLSSHHPYSIPAKYKNRFSEGTLGIHRSIQYADFSLQRFFKDATASEQYDNTVFIITADHTGPLESEKYQSTYGKYAVPIIIHSKLLDSLNGRYSKTCQHTDIFPTILELAGSSNEFKSFGESLFKKGRKNYSIQFANQMYQFICGEKIILFDGEKVQAVYNIKNDPKMLHNIYNPSKDNNELNLLKSLIQQYNDGMINNKLVL